MFLLDTNVISALRRPERLPPEVTSWADEADVDQCYISVISVLEIELGILAKERVDASTGRILRTWFQTDVLAAFDDRIIPIDTEVAMRCAALHVPDPQPERDGLIAATAVVHSMTLVTRNVAGNKRHRMHNRRRGDQTIPLRLGIRHMQCGAPHRDFGVDRDDAIIERRQHVGLKPCPQNAAGRSIDALLG